MDQHTLSVLVENKPGVLVRIAGLFSRRGFNIESLAVGPTEHEEISRMTIVVNCEEHPLEQVTKQLNKLINVIKIVELEPTQAVQRELMLIKVRADTDSRSKVLETVELFRAHVVDVAVDAVTVEATGGHDKLEALVRVLEPFGIKELVKSGTIAVGRGGRSITDRTLRPLERSRLNQHRLRPQVKREYSRTNSCFASTAMTCWWSQPHPFRSKVILDFFNDEERAISKWQRSSTTTTPTSR